MTGFQSLEAQRLGQGDGFSQRRLCLCVLSQLEFGQAEIAQRSALDVGLTGSSRMSNRRGEERALPTECRCLTIGVAEIVGDLRGNPDLMRPSATRSARR
jgi:hypothetical protein